MMNNPVRTNTDPKQVAEQFAAEMRVLEERFAEQNPGVQAVVEMYALTQPSIQQYDAYLQALDARPITRTSNGTS